MLRAALVTGLAFVPAESRRLVRERGAGTSKCSERRT
jgi:hypothetical protein